MAIDIIARGLASSLLGSDGKVASDKMPVLSGTSDLTGFTSIGKLTDASLVEGKTAEEILLMMLYGVVSPTLTEPSLSIAISDESLPLIIGREQALKGALTFDRGKIEPAYGTSGYRAGAPTNYSIGDTTVEATGTSYDFEISLIPTETSVTLNYGVAYGEGEQPLNSIGQAFSAPYPAGSIASTTTVTATYAIYDAFGNELSFTWFEDSDGQGYFSTFASEGSGIKQSFCISDKLNVVGIKGFDTLTQQWTWLGGESAKGSLTHFDTTTIIGESLGETTNYTLYTHNQPASGERELRIYVI